VAPDLSKASLNGFHSFFSIARAILNGGTVPPMLYVYAIPTPECKDWMERSIIDISCHRELFCSIDKIGDIQNENPRLYEKLNK
jgi:hypothetical protein